MNSLGKPIIIDEHALSPFLILPNPVHKCPPSTPFMSTGIAFLRETYSRDDLRVSPK